MQNWKSNSETCEADILITEFNGKRQFCMSLLPA